MIFSRDAQASAARRVRTAFLVPLFALLALCAGDRLSAAEPAAAAAELSVPVRIELGAEDPSLSVLADFKVDVDAVFDGWARVYLKESERLKLVRNGFRATLLPNPERALAAALLEQPPRSEDLSDGRVSTVYHTYTTLTADLQAIAADHADIARLYSIGESVQGRQLWMMKLSDNPDVDEDEPELSIISSMHGDEVVGKELTFNLIDYLTNNYGSDARATDLVNGAEIWIMPSMNPDGTQLGQRYNANGVDLNRNFPDQFVDAVNTGFGREAETARVMHWALDRRIMIASNFHGGALVANYPWDSNPAGTSTHSPSPDDEEFVLMARTYADNNPPMSVSNSHPAWDNGITNGADWYSVNGGMQDWNYVWNGGFEVLMELSNTKWPPGADLPQYWADNFESMMSYLELGFRGLRGVVTDASTGLPVAATITIDSSIPALPSYTDPDVGDYHRLVLPGTYAVTFASPGYASSTVTGVVVGSGAATRLDVTLGQITADLQFAEVIVLDGAGGDGWLDPDETADLAVTLDNLGGLATGVTATLESTGPYAQVVRADATYPDVSPGGSAQSLTPHFRVSLPAGVPPTHRPGFVVHWQADQTSGVTAPFFLKVGAPQCATVFASGLPSPIADFQTTLSQLEFANAWEIAEVRVPVNITHSYIGDLSISLLSPGGKNLQLHARTGGTTNNIVGTYGLDLTPVDAFDTLVGQESTGTWRLSVADLAGGDTGSLNQFGIEICGHPLVEDCTVDPDCDDGQYCNGAETCGAGTCQAGTPPACDDGVGCTSDSCNEATDACDSAPSNAACDNGLYCDGVETCDAVLDCQAGTPPDCDDGVDCTDDRCNEAADRCDVLPSDAFCDNGLYCDGAETCDPALGCRPATDPCSPLGCDEGLDRCVCQTQADCDDGLYCNGAETCDGVDCQPGGAPCAGEPGCDEGLDRCVCLTAADCDDGSFCNGAETCDGADCQPGGDPCVGFAGCDEAADQCIAGAVARLETHVVNAGGAFQTVALAQSYISPVVVCSAQYAANALPVVTRVANVTATSFDVRLQNPSNAAVATDLIHCLVAEAGVWNVDGLKVEAFTYSSTVVDDNNSWVAQAQAYGQSYTSPVVLGQVMTQNSAAWSVFWSQGSSRSNPPSATALKAGKHVGQDPVLTRAAETVGVIVLESGHGTLAGVEYEAGLGPDIVAGATNSPPYNYSFAVPFASAPTVAVVSQSAMDGVDGSWGQVHGAAPLTATRLSVSVDEDQLADAERSHTTEQLAYAAFAGVLVYPGVPACGVDADCDDGLYCNGAETCDAGACRAGTPPACGDGVGCTVDTCNEATDGCDSAPSDAACDNGLYCDGAETCHATLDCQAGTAPVCDDGVGCTIDSCDEAADACAALPDDGACGNGLYCDGAEVCDPALGCQAASDPCAPLGCDEGLDQCVCQTAQDCDDGNFCNGAETCDGVSCLPGADPCAGLAGCDEGADQCLTGPVARLETHRLSVASAFVTVSLDATYVSPVVVCSPQYAAGVLPVVTRVRNVTPVSFDVRLQNPSESAIVADTVHCLVVEEGVWDVEGLKVEAFTTNSTVTNENGGWVGQAQSYGRAYASPVVLGQVMTQNDADWSVFWSYATYRSAPPTAAALSTGKHVGSDPDITRAAEVLGVIVFEAGHGTLGGVEYEVAVSPDTVEGVTNGAPHTVGFVTPFASVPGVAVVTQTAMDGTDGSWGYLYGGSPFTTTSLDLSVDEDQTADAERGHVNEQIAYAVFGTDLRYPPVPSCTVDQDCDDGLLCNGAETCGAGGCQAGAPVVCDDGAFCNGAEACDESLGCVSGADPCAAGACDEGLDQCLCQTDPECDDGLFCNGAETCNGIDCVAGSDPCAGQAGCDEATDQCLSGPVARLESHVVTVGSTFQTVNLTQAYVSPVVACSPQYVANSLPIVTRVRNVGASSFEVRLQNPSGNPIAADPVHCLVVKQGVWVMQGLKVEAFTYLSTVTDSKPSWTGRTHSYGQSYSSPVVLGQVMTQADSAWSVFWDSASSRSAPPSSTSLRTGKHVGSDPNRTRAAETIGVIVFEAGHGQLAGIEYDAGLGPDTVAGVVNTPPYANGFNAPFATVPTVAVVTQAAMDGTDGGWAQLYGASPMSQTSIGVAVDEDQLDDSERSHTTEQVARVVFAGAVRYPAPPR